jgi:DNA-binding NarL/FixJ family response regulator
MLVDLNMPRMNGIEFVQALRDDRELQRSIVFILTTSKRDEDKIAAYDLNVAGYIAKATAEDDIRNLVSLLDSYGRIVELP